MLCMNYQSNSGEGVLVAKTYLLTALIMSMVSPDVKSSMPIKVRLILILLSSQVQTLTRLNM